MTIGKPHAYKIYTMGNPYINHSRASQAQHTRVARCHTHIGVPHVCGMSHSHHTLYMDQPPRICTAYQFGQYVLPEVQNVAALFRAECEPISPTTTPSEFRIVTGFASSEASVEQRGFTSASRPTGLAHGTSPLSLFGTGCDSADFSDLL